MVTDRRDELERWIAGSRATQKKLKLGLAAALAVSIALMVVSRAAGGIGLAITALVALSGFWITAGHIADWQERIYKLDHPEAAKPGGRRYQRD
ncbi:MAG: hypothetical protein JO257_01600 [Deltaproteobacteria bacterium]|nr:hypothetical protein [Deltaproteobacteria bacterium]